MPWSLFGTASRNGTAEPNDDPDAGAVKGVLDVSVEYGGESVFPEASVIVA